MSLAKSKEVLKQLIEDKNNKVIALTGRWGIGKTHLWEDLQRMHLNRKKAAKFFFARFVPFLRKNIVDENKQIRQALYVSLFGSKDIQDLKVRMILSEISKPNATEALTNAWAGSMTVMKEINPMLGSLDQLAKLLLPGLLKNRMVIIDDLERKHCDLGIAEIMGFINQLTEQYNSRVILIMNTGQLETADQEMWALLCEKIIDHQIILNTTPDEAFDIALECLMKNEEPYPDQYINEVKVACSACDINNIRIIQKIIRVTNRMIAFLLASQPNISDKFIRIAIPSTVLLTAIHYKGIKDGPDSDYVLKYNEYSYRIEQNVGALQRASVEKDINEEDEKKRKDESRWSNLMRSLGIVTGGVYEKQVNAFLTTGTLDEEELNDFVGKSRHEKELTDSREAHRKFLATMVWDVNMSDEDRLREARKVAKKVRLLNEYEVSQFHDKVKIINGGLALAQYCPFLFGGREAAKLSHGVK